MSLSPEEYREHLATTAVRAGFSFGEVALPQSHDVQIGGMRLHYLDWGNKHLPPMLFLHGGALNAHTWDLVCLALRESYHCLALDLRGHGDRDWADDYSFAGDIHDIQGMIDQLGLGRPVIVGQSRGGMGALVYAVEHS